MFDGRGDTGWVDVSNTLGAGAVQYRINAAGVCSVSVVATAATTSGVTYTICTLPLRRVLLVNGAAKQCLTRCRARW